MSSKVFVQNADGSAPPQRVTSESNADVGEFPSSFSPDGRALLLTVLNYTRTAEFYYETFLLPLAGERKLLPFLQVKYTVAGARFSPDGRWVAYLSNESGRPEVYVRPYPGPGPKWQISTESGREGRWSRSGRELFYREGEKLMAVEVELSPALRAGKPKPLFEGPYGNYDVAPDGRFLMIKPDPAEAGPVHVKVVLNWFEEVKRRVPGAK